MRRLSNPLVFALLAASLVVAAGRAAAQAYLLKVRTGGPGTVSPGTVQVPAGGSQKFTFTPSAGNVVVDVTVDDVSLGSGLTEYTFTNVQSDHLLYVSFGTAPPPPPPPLNTSMTLKIAPMQVDSGGSVVMTAVVSPSNASGPIHFLDVTHSPVEVGAASIVNGTASFAYGPLSGPSRILQARYDGDGLFLGCTSNQAFLKVGIEPPPGVDPKLWITDGSVGCIVRDGNTIYIGGGFRHVGPATGEAVAIDASTAAVQQPYPRVNGPVSTVAPDGSGGWYLGGSFTAVRGLPRNNLAHLDAAGNLTPWNPNAIGGGVSALALSGGTVIVGGSFTSVGGQTRNGIAALDAATGAVTSWNPNPSGTFANGYPTCVYALALDGGTVYAGGNFRSIGGWPRNAIAALDAATGLATAWDPYADNEVLSLAVTGGTVCAGGRFTSIGALPRSGIAALDAATGLATAWNPDAQSNYHPFPNYPDYVQPPVIRALVVNGSTVYVGGFFTGIGGQSRNSIAALDATTGVATAWNPNAGYTQTVRGLAVSGGTVYAGGDFGNIGGQPRHLIAALDATTGAATAWDPSALGDGNVSALAVSGNTVYAGGAFAGMGAQARGNIAALDAITGAATGWNPNANSSLIALAVSGGTVYAGGYFTNIGGQPRSRIAALDATTGAATAWDPNPHLNAFGGRNLEVNALAVSGGTVYAGGSFTDIGGQPRNNIAALDATTGAATAWDPNVDWPNANGPYATIYALTVSGGIVHAGGSFTTVGGQPRNHLAGIDATTGAATAWNPKVLWFGGPENASVRSLAVSQGIVYAGGVFTSIGGQTRNYLAGIGATTGVPTAWNPNANGNLDFDPPRVSALVMSGNTIYAGGSFTGIGGQQRNGIAALDVSTGAATAWNPDASATVLALALSGTTVYAGGTFTTVGGQPQPSIAAISGVDFQDATLLAQLEAATSADGIELRWSFGDASQVASVVVERAPAVVGPWLAIAPELRDDSGVTVALDRTAGESGQYFYRLVVQLTGGGQTVFGPVSASSRELPSRSDLTRLSPNPTSGGTQVQYAVARAGRVRLDVLDVSGRVEETLADRIQTPGRYVVTWDGVGRRGRLSPGLHFVRFVAPDQVMVKKLAIIR